MTGRHWGLKPEVFRPKGTWNLYWCSDMWCDCKIGKMWKNSTLSNPIYHTPTCPICNSCLCHVTNGYTSRCVTPNFGELASVTCNLCTPQNQKGERTTKFAHFPCVDPLV